MAFTEQSGKRQASMKRTISLFSNVSSGTFPTQCNLPGLIYLETIQPHLVDFGKVFDRGICPLDTSHDIPKHLVVCIVRF